MGEEQNENVWGHLEAGHREMQRAMLQVLWHCQVVEALRTFKRCVHNNVACCRCAGDEFHHWSSHAMRGLQLSARDPDIVALLVVMWCSIRLLW